MRVLSLCSALLLAIAISCSAAEGSQSASTTITADPTTVRVGNSVDISVQVQPTISGDITMPPTPTGGITLFDGTTPLNITPIPLGAGNAFSSKTFQEVFGTVDARLADVVQGELAGPFSAGGQTGLVLYSVRSTSTSPVADDQIWVQTFVSDDKGGFVAQPLSFLIFGSYPIPKSGVTRAPTMLDVDGDGKSDLLYDTFVAYGEGDGTFSQPEQLQFLASGGFSGSYAADVNGDGRVDIIAINTPPSSSGPSADQDFQYQMTVFENQGSGHFSSLGTFPISIMSSFPPNSLVAENVFDLSFADLNGDGKLDIIAQSNFVFAGNAASTDNFTVILNNGDGTFSNPLLIDTSHIPYPTSAGFPVALADMNGDSKADLVLDYQDQSGNSFISVESGNGDGTFQNPQILQLNAPSSIFTVAPPVVVDDLNFDGKLDLVLGNGLVALGNGDGTLVQGSPLFSRISSNLTLLSYPVVLANLSSGSIPSLTFVDLQSNNLAVFTSQVSSSASFSISTLSAGSHSITGQYSGDANYGTDTSQPVLVTVSTASTTTIVTSSANQSFAGQNVIFTAKVTSNGPTPSGTVTFSSGDSTLATKSVSDGSATYTTTFNDAGNSIITASYSGDNNNQASSGSVNQSVIPAFNLQPGAGGKTSITVKSGQSATIPISLVGVTGFSGVVTFACTNLPQQASCSFNPATVSASEGASITTTLTVNTSGSATTSADTMPFALGGSTMFTCGVVVLWPSRRKRTRSFLVLSCALGLAVLGTLGCGTTVPSSSSISRMTPSGTYTFNIVASSGSVLNTVAYTLNVQ